MICRMSFNADHHKRPTTDYEKMVTLRVRECKPVQPYTKSSAWEMIFTVRPRRVCMSHHCVMRLIQAFSWDI